MANTELNSCVFFYFFLNGPAPASFLYIFVFYKYTTKKFSSQRDLNWDLWSRRQGCWPLKQHHHVPPSIPIANNLLFIVRWKCHPTSWRCVSVADPRQRFGGKLLPHDVSPSTARHREPSVEPCRQTIRLIQIFTFIDQVTLFKTWFKFELTRVNQPLLHLKKSVSFTIVQPDLTEDPPTNETKSCC